ncbi:MAG TPA: PDR/VanB family oxidoreductase [Acetobacteraceae bacterium]|nr:PDR/VanB family oxidoreductase [Acetobacteraceae bacterium]
MAHRSAEEWQPARLTAIRDLTPDIRMFEIAPESGFVQPQPGSHIDLALRIGERADVRSYSVVGPCRDGVYRIAVKRLPTSRGGSAYMWTLPVGARLTIAPPANLFPLTRGRPEYLLVAGGIGITPIYGIALALAGAGAPFRMLYGCRSRDQLALGEELRARIGDRLEPYISAEGKRVDFGREVARLAPGGEVYVCGPIGMMEAAKHAWAASGRPPELLRFETFGSSGRYASVPFVVRIPRLDREIRVPAEASMLDALEAAGVGVIADCRRGECGLCALPILGVEGVVDHRDVFFSDGEKAENAKLCTCVSRVWRAGEGAAITIDTADREM